MHELHLCGSQGFKIQVSVATAMLPIQLLDDESKEISLVAAATGFRFGGSVAKHLLHYFRWRAKRSLRLLCGRAFGSCDTAADISM